MRSLKSMPANINLQDLNVPAKMVDKLINIIGECEGVGNVIEALSQAVLVYSQQQAEKQEYPLTAEGQKTYTQISKHLLRIYCTGNFRHY